MIKKAKKRQLNEIESNEEIQVERNNENINKILPKKKKLIKSKESGSIKTQILNDSINAGQSLKNPKKNEKKKNKKHENSTVNETNSSSKTENKKDKVISSKRKEYFKKKRESYKQKKLMGQEDGETHPIKKLSLEEMKAKIAEIESRETLSKTALRKLRTLRKKVKVEESAINDTSDLKRKADSLENYDKKHENKKLKKDISTEIKANKEKKIKQEEKETVKELFIEDRVGNKDLQINKNNNDINVKSQNKLNPAKLKANMKVNQKVEELKVQNNDSDDNVNCETKSTFINENDNNSKNKSNKKIIIKSEKLLKNEKLKIKNMEKKNVSKKKEVSDNEINESSLKLQMKKNKISQNSNKQNKKSKNAEKINSKEEENKERTDSDESEDEEIETDDTIDEEDLKSQKIELKNQKKKDKKGKPNTGEINKKIKDPEPRNDEDVEEAEESDDESEDDEQNNEIDSDNSFNKQIKKNAGKNNPQKETNKIFKKQEKNQINENDSSGKKRRYVLFVGNLAYDTTTVDLKKHFLTKISKVKDVRIPLNPETNASRGFAYIEVENNVDYEKSLSLHGTFLKNRPIKVEYTRPGSKKVGNRQEVVHKNKKLHAMRKAGMLAGSKKSSKQRSARRKHQQDSENAFTK